MPPPKALKLLKHIGMPRRTEHTIVVATDLMKELVTIAERGFAFDDEEDNIGVAGVASTVCDRHGDGVAAFGVTCLKGARTEADLIAIDEIVRRYASRISQMLGATGSDD
jgi:IclR family acetate operon transcriptional repressor